MNAHFHYKLEEIIVTWVIITSYYVMKSTYNISSSYNYSTICLHILTFTLFLHIAN